MGYASGHAKPASPASSKIISAIRSAEAIERVQPIWPCPLLIHRPCSGLWDIIGRPNRLTGRLLDQIRCGEPRCDIISGISSHHLCHKGVALNSPSVPDKRKCPLKIVSALWVAASITGACGRSDRSRPSVVKSSAKPRTALIGRFKSKGASSSLTLWPVHKII